MVSVQLGPVETLVQAASKHLASPIKARTGQGEETKARRRQQKPKLKQLYF